MTREKERYGVTIEAKIWSFSSNPNAKEFHIRKTVEAEEPLETLIKKTVNYVEGFPG